MPTYEYKCLDCQDRFETFQRMTDEPLQTCSKCNGRLKRLIGTGAGIIFKGSGFYITDYRSDSYKQAERRASSDTGSSSSSTSSSTTAKSSTAETKKP